MYPPYFLPFHQFYHQISLSDRNSSCNVVWSVYWKNEGWYHLARDTLRQQNGLFLGFLTGAFESKCDPQGSGASPSPALLKPMGYAVSRDDQCSIEFIVLGTMEVCGPVLVGVSIAKLVNN